MGNNEKSELTTNLGKPEERNELERPTSKEVGEAAVKKTFGIKDVELAADILGKTAYTISPKDPNSEYSLTLAIQSISDQMPKDAVEVRLVSQITALYCQGMVYLAKADAAARFEHMQCYGNLAVKLLRLHNETVEALSRYRRGGEQKVIVTHIAEKIAVVNNYGLAGGGEAQQTEEQPHVQRVRSKRQINRP